MTDEPIDYDNDPALNTFKTFLKSRQTSYAERMLESATREKELWCARVKIMTKLLEDHKKDLG